MIFFTVVIRKLWNWLFCHCFCIECEIYKNKSENFKNCKIGSVKLSNWMKLDKAIL